MIKDCIYISIFMLLAISYVALFRSLISERNYFINTLSHDFRVVVLSQIKALNLLQNKNKVEYLESEIIKDLDESSKFSLELINSLINTYKYKNNEKILNYESFYINEMISNIYDKFLPLIKSKCIDLYCDIKSFIEVNADKKELSKAVEILLLTAIYNANKDSKIIVEIKNDNKNLKISILYNGCKLTEEEIRRMFYDNTNFSAVGHGVKLHLCKNIIDLHSGKINVCTLNSGRTSLTVTIPNKSVKNSCMKVLQPCTY